MQIPVCEIFWQRFFISWINGAIFYLHDVNFWLSFFGPSFRYNLVTIGVLEFVVVIDVYAQPTREKIKFYRTASKTTRYVYIKFHIICFDFKQIGERGYGTLHPGCDRRGLGRLRGSRTDLTHAPPAF